MFRFIFVSLSCFEIEWSFFNLKYFLYNIRIVVFIISQLSYFCKPRFLLFVRNCMWMYHYWLNPYFAKMNIVKNRMQKAYVKRRETYSYGLRMGQGVYCITFEPCACNFLPNTELLKKEGIQCKICNIAVLLQIRPFLPVHLCIQHNVQNFVCFCAREHERKMEVREHSINGNKDFFS